MDNKAREQYLATQPVAPRAERVAAEPLPTLGTVEITVVLVFAVLVVYAVWRIIRDIVNKSPPKDKS